MRKGGECVCVCAWGEEWECVQECDAKAVVIVPYGAVVDVDVVALGVRGW